MHVSKKAGHFDKLCDRPLVEISGLEPELAEPKSVVLPLHHTSIPWKKRSKLKFFTLKPSNKQFKTASKHSFIYEYANDGCGV